MGQQSTKISKEEISQLSDQTYFNKKEIGDWHRGFIKDCPSGSLNKDEFKVIYKKFFPFGDSSEFAEHIFRVFDKDQSGKIDFEEFIVTLSTASRGTLAEKLDWSFKLYDVDNNGQITREEMLEVVEAVYKMVGSMVKLPEDEDTAEKKVAKIFNLFGKQGGETLDPIEFKSKSEKDDAIVKALKLYDGLV